MRLTGQVFKNYSYIVAAVLPVCFAVNGAFAQARRDSSVQLKKVTVKGYKATNVFNASLPAQLLNKETLQQLNAYSVGDAAKYFSGVLVKDYGGIGGLKTVSVRSLGASQTGVFYDGLPVADAQSGQMDLSRFSTSFVQSLQLSEANGLQLLLPARSYSHAAVLDVNSNSFNTGNFSKTNWQAGLKAGSFGLWQPFAGVYLPVAKNTVVSANAEFTRAKGDYPFYIDNGDYSKKNYRSNSDIQSFQGEINLVKMFADSSYSQTKLGGYTSERGLPGSVIFFNDRSVQRLWNRDFFVQSRYRKKLGRATALLLSGKYSQSYTRYVDPDFLNSAGELDNHYRQQEVYVSAAVTQNLSKELVVSAASDVSVAHLTANLFGFVVPTRTTLWNNVALQYTRTLLKVDASLLYTNVKDKVQSGNAAGHKNQLTPTVAMAFKPGLESPLLLRLFYKNIFRMPSFNDLYYTIIGNNIALRPEFTNQYNAGITYSKFFTKGIKQASVSVDGYYNTVKDKIIAVPSRNLFVWSMLNLGRVHIKGVDVTGELNGKFSSAAGWFTRVAYTWQQALDVTDKSSASYKNQIPYTPNSSGSGLLGFSYRQWSAGYNMLFSGSRYALGENNAANKLNGWASQDVFVSRLVKLPRFQSTVKAEINNLGNQRYDVVKYFPMPGRSFKISITINNL